jgi:hypothetical protein
MHLRATTAVGIMLMCGTSAVGAAPLRGRALAYGGIGATVASFYTANPHGVGRPPAGKSYYRVDETRNGRVSSYHVVVGAGSAPSATGLLARLTGTELPTDAHLVKPYNRYCAVYRSRWLGKVVFGLPGPFGTHHVFRTAYIIVYVPEREPLWSNGVMASLAPACRG